MSRAMRVGFLAIVGATLALASCSNPDDLEIRNESDQAVSVSTGDETLTVDATGGVVLLGNGCTSGDVLVTRNDGESVTLDGPVCPPSSIVITDASIRVVD